jgi:hypothetical protein
MPRLRHCSVTKRRLRPSRLESWCGGSITECIGQGLKNTGPVAFTSLSCIIARSMES